MEEKRNQVQVEAVCSHAKLEIISGNPLTLAIDCVIYSSIHPIVSHGYNALCGDSMNCPSSALALRLYEIDE